MRPEVERVQNLLSDTVTLLCKNGLTYDKEMRVQGLLGITLDEKEVFVVHINELFSQAGATLVSLQEDEDDDSQSANDIPLRTTKKSDSHTGRSKEATKRSHPDSIDLGCVKLEKDDVVILDAKPEPAPYILNEHGPASKRRLVDSSPVLTQASPLPGGQYLTGILGHADNSNTSWDGTQPPNTHLPGMNTLATSSNNSMPVLDQQSASWDPTRPVPGSLNNQQQLSTDSVAQYMFLEMGRGRTRLLTKTTDNKFVCSVDGCNKAFKHSFILYRHQREKHGASYVRPQASRQFRTDALDQTSHLWMPLDRQTSGEEQNGRGYSTDLEGGEGSLERQGSHDSAPADLSSSGRDTSGMDHVLYPGLPPNDSAGGGSTEEGRSGLPGIRSFVATDGRESPDGGNDLGGV